MLTCLRMAAPVAALVLASSVCAQDRGEPPVAGDLLLELIGRHFANPAVAAMIAWSGCGPVSAGDVDAKSPALELTLDRDRVRAVKIQAGPPGSDEGWTAALPGSLTWSTTPAMLEAQGPWRQDVKGQRYVARVSKATGFGDKEINDYEPRGQL
ncbi:MAG: hypothetical protein R3F49_23105 [Planctomycetota bacterium]